MELANPAIFPATVREEQTAVTVGEARSVLRRVEVDAKHNLLVKLLQDTGAEGVLILNPANIRWLTSGANFLGLLGTDEAPALYFSTHQRHLLASAVDTQRFFEKELDGLGFQLKEWQWTRSRDQLLGELVYGRKIACDGIFRDCINVSNFFDAERRKLTGFEFDRLRELGGILSHALEATARTFHQGETEYEIAGQIGHRLYRHGAEPVTISIVSDGRAQRYRREGTSDCCLHTWGTFQATARMNGLHATASRTVHFGPMPQALREAYDLALKLSAAFLVVSKQGEKISHTLEVTKNILKGIPYEHDWRLAPIFQLTGLDASEGTFATVATDRWHAGWACVWQARVGPTAVIDTYALDDTGWNDLTKGFDWPLRRLIIQGKSYERPDVLIRPV